MPLIYKKNKALVKVGDKLRTIYTKGGRNDWGILTVESLETKNDDNFRSINLRLESSGTHALYINALKNATTNYTIKWVPWNNHYENGEYAG